MDGKSDKLTDTAKKYICQLYDSEQRKVNYSIESKYLEKGLTVENESIALAKWCKFGGYSNLTEKRYFDQIEYKKNEKTFKNKWLIGTPDIIYKDSIGSKEYLVVDDVKSSYTRATWLFSVSQLIENKTCIKEYYWQLQAYMMLTGSQTSNLIYCLINTPCEIIESEKRKLSYKYSGQEFEEYCENLDRLHNFDEFSKKERCFIKEIQRNDNDIEKIKERVEYANEWLFKNVERNYKEKNAHLGENSAFEI
jgi:hypothetical protein